MLVISNLLFLLRVNPYLKGHPSPFPLAARLVSSGAMGQVKQPYLSLSKVSFPLMAAVSRCRLIFELGVEQEAPASDDSLLDTVLAADTERAALLVEAESCEDADRIGEIYQRLEDIDAYTAEP